MTIPHSQHLADGIFAHHDSSRLQAATPSMIET
jgi:hypothetical protein